MPPPVAKEEMDVRKAICHYSFHRRWRAENWTVDRLAEEVENLDVEGVDFHAGFLPPPSEAAGLIRSALDRHGRVLSGLSMSNNFNQDDPEALREQIETVKRWLTVAEEVSAPVSRIFGGHLSAEQRGDPAAAAQGRGRILDALGEVAREAETRGLVLALENHGGLPCTGQEQVEIIETVGSPALKATIDVGNYMQGGQEGHEGTQVAAAHAAYVHFKDFRKIPDESIPWGWKLEPATVGDGDVDLRACVQALRDAGYDGFVALEYEGLEEEATGVPRSVAFMNQVL